MLLLHHQCIVNPGTSEKKRLRLEIAADAQPFQRGRQIKGAPSSLVPGAFGRAQPGISFNRPEGCVWFGQDHAETRGRGTRRHAVPFQDDDIEATFRQHIGRGCTDEAPSDDDDIGLLFSTKDGK
jgi:hypothetical protein